MTKYGLAFDAGCARGNSGIEEWGEKFTQPGFRCSADDCAFEDQNLAPVLRWCLIRLTKNYLVGIMPKTSHFVTRHLRRHQIQVNRDKWQSYWHSTKATIAVSAASLRLATRSCVPNIRD
jgi:hypothetical protein